MVYQTLEIVLGVVVTFDDLKDLLDVEDPYDIDEDDMRLIRDWGHHVPKIYRFHCCSNSAKEKFIIGYTVHTYYRNNITCEKCGKHTACDKCIGFTNNGYYDVQKILDEPTTVDVRQLCLNCYHDNRKDMGGLTESCPFVKGKGYQPRNAVDKAITKGEGEKCGVCNLAIKSYRCPQEHVEVGEIRHKKLKTFIDECDIKSEVNFYYMLNDCLSCS